MSTRWSSIIEKWSPMPTRGPALKSTHAVLRGWAWDPALT
jgi:hypothetical protein